MELAARRVDLTDASPGSLLVVLESPELLGLQSCAELCHVWVSLQLTEVRCGARALDANLPAQPRQQQRHRCAGRLNEGGGPGEQWRQ